jgi:hypothetical protein
MARMVVFTDDLLFGSNVLGALRAAGHEPTLAGDAEALRRELGDAQVLIVDLTSDATERLEVVGAMTRPDLRTLAFYAHVEADVRAQAERGGLDLVVPRSRMAREGASLVERLLASGEEA